MAEPKGEGIEKLEGVEVVKVGMPLPARITKLIRTTAGEVFGDKTAVRRDESIEEAKLRPTLWFAFEGTGFAGNASYSIPEKAGPSTSLGKHVARYGAFPFKGQEISVHLNEDNFYKVDL